MGNTYISVLGTGGYLECTYYWGTQFRKPGARFVQEATVDFFCGDWNPEDRILILTTEEARRTNWLDNGHRDRSGRIIPGEGLKSRLARLDTRASVLRVSIPEGKTEDEIRRIFRILFENLGHGDRVVFDITHSFRSIPLLVMVVLQYAKAIKDVSVQGIYYGAFEVLGRPDLVRELPPEERKAPIFDLTPFDGLLDWSTAIDRFLGTGDSALVCKLARDAVNPVLSRTKGKDKAAAAIRGVAKRLDTFSRDLSTCRGPMLSRNAAELKRRITECREREILPEFRPLLDRLSHQIDSFDGEEVADGIRAARWCLDHNLVQQGYTILQEFLLSHAAREAGLDPTDGTDRSIASQAVAIAARGLPMKQWKEPAASCQEKTAQALRVLERNPDLTKIFRAIADDRNDLNHAGCNKEPRSSRSFLRNLPGLLERAERIVAREP